MTRIGEIGNQIGGSYAKEKLHKYVIESLAETRAVYVTVKLQKVSKEQLPGNYKINKSHSSHRPGGHLNSDWQ